MDTPASDERLERLILDAIDRFLDAEVRPQVRRLEEEDIYPERIVEQMKAMGLFEPVPV